MAFGKGIGLQGLKYQGGGAMLAWLLHRISGLVMVLFISGHVVAGFMQHTMDTHPRAVDIGNAINTFYEGRIFQAILYFCVIFHVLNGLRIALLDFFPQYIKFQREAIWLQWVILIPVYGMALYFMLLRQLFGW